MEQKKRVFLCQGWGTPPDQLWLPFVKEHFENQGIEVIGVDGAGDGNVELWVDKLRAIVGRVDGNTYFFGQSVGNQNILRFLASLPDDAPACGGWVGVAPWLSLDWTVKADRPQFWDEFFQNFKHELEPWTRMDNLNVEKIKAKCPKRHVILSTDDPCRGMDSHGLDNKKDFEEILGATVHLFEGEGHFMKPTLTQEQLAVFDEVLQ